MDIFWHSLEHAVIDTLYVIPVLYLAYLLVSYFSHNDNEKFSKILHKTKKAGPAIGAVLGCIPQCGFSSLMSQLYSKKIITLGTLIAVFIATSDEALPLMISQPQFIPSLLIMMAIKVVYAIIAGYLIDGIYRIILRKKPVLNEYHDKHEHAKQEHHDNVQNAGLDAEIVSTKNLPQNTVENTLQENGVETNNDMPKKDSKWKKFCSKFKKKKKSYKCDHAHEDEHGHDHTHGHCCATNIFVDALKHTMIIVLYVFIVTLAINLIEGYAGGLEPLQRFFSSNVYLQILLASVIGLIPNCAASVFLVELFMANVLYFPALVAGLSAGAGVGLIVLFTANYKKVWVNISITVLLFVLALIIGIITNFLPIW